MIVGILSMQRIRNYGSFLQAYGLKSMIESLGHEVEFVDYTVGKPIVQNEHKNNDNKNIIIVRKIVNKIRNLISRFEPNNRNAKRMALQQREWWLNFGKEMWPMLGIKGENYRPELDVLVIGSDEVFNCLQTSTEVGYSLELFGANNNAKKLISYAASFGNTTVERLKRFGKAEEIAEYLKKFDALSVRDMNSVNTVRELTGIEPFYHIDPVLISDFSSQKVSNMGLKDFIIVYAYPGRISKEEKKIIKEFARSKGKKLISIQSAHDFVDEFWDGNPFEVLEYFNEADYIITDTFHGSIFSIINHKSFVTLVRKTVGNSYGNEEKLTDLLNRLGLKNRIAKNPSDISRILEEQIDYTNVDAIRNKEREITLNYLREHLGE